MEPLSQEVIHRLINLSRDMAAAGERRLMVISGEAGWAASQALALNHALAGDWLWVTDGADGALRCPPRQLRGLLGREFLHGVFDARQGLDAEAVAAVAGTLKAGSWLVLLTPEWQRWPHQPDVDSLRWSECPAPIATPHFIFHMQRVLCQCPDVLHLTQGQTPGLISPVTGPAWHPANGAPEAQQARVLDALLKMPPGVAAVTAGRGRGKSALAGMLIARYQGRCLVTAPAKAATDVLARHAGERFEFFAPDALIAALDNGNAPLAEWLIIDEAAAIPGPMLSRLIGAWPKVLLTTTVQGYEGTGRGFMLKFCAHIPGLLAFNLDTPIRWRAGCPLEQLIDRLFLFDDTLPPARLKGPVSLCGLEPGNSALEPIYTLLASAHYRTTPLDLRRMMDAPGQHLFAARQQQQTLGALWMVSEGGLSPALSEAVWAGLRRPRGNLVAQSLAAHGGSPLAATLRGQRITRIAVHPDCQGQGIGQQLVAYGREQAQVGVDYLSVSFGYTLPLWRFWQRCGFTLVRFGTHREASSGCYTAMALLPLTAPGEAMAHREAQRLARDVVWLQAQVAEVIPVSALKDATLNDDDWQELAGFAWGYRPLEACLGSLNRLLMLDSIPALSGQLQQGKPVDALCQSLKLSGRKALLNYQRGACATCLHQRDPERAAGLEKAMMQLQFFQRDVQ